MEVLSWISNCIILFLLIFFAWPIVCYLIGLFSDLKRAPEAESGKIAVLICARNEETVIGNLLESLARQDYPADRYQVFVAAHNCTDRTEEIARSHGATVLVRNEPAEKCKGAALRYAIGEIRTRYPGVFDTLCLFDADNVAGRDFLKEINAALQNGADAAQGYRRSKNYHQNAVSELFGAYWHLVMIGQNLPHTLMGLPVTLSGTGFAVRMDAIGDTWNTFTMIEDIEFTCQLVLAGKKIVLAPHAVFYDEQPVDLRIALRQRYRWAVGSYQVLKGYFFKLIRAIPRRGAAAFKMATELLINPVLLISFAAIVTQGVCIAINYGIPRMLLYFLILISVIWIYAQPLNVFLFIKERMNPLKNIATILFFPLFLSISFLFSVIPIFDRNPQWKPIPHSDTQTIETLEK